MRTILKSTIIIVLLCLGTKNIGANTIYTSITTEKIVKGKQTENLRKKVLASFKEDMRKQAAAKFLLENMDAHYSLESSRIKTFQSYMDSIFTHYADRKNDFHKAAYDSASARYGPFDVDFTKVYDTENVTAEYLIQQINEAFDAWGKPWNRDVSFSQFCHYVLPYRIGHEPLSPWYVGEVESARQVEKLILNNFTNPPIGAYSMLTPGQAQGKYIYEGKSSFAFHPYTRDKGDRRLYKAKARYAAGYVIRKGTPIYALSFTADGKPYTTYVFVDPNTLKVITEAYCNLFWYKIPLTLIADKDKFRNHGN